MHDLKREMHRAGYAIFKIMPDRANAGKSVVVVYQDIKRMGTHPAFWSVLDMLQLSGAWSMNLSCQTRIELPAGVYLTFV